MSEQKLLSLCIITKNDEVFLPACIEEMAGIADEMIVVDLGSNDRTTELARDAGASAYQPEWLDDFSKIKNFCMDRALCKWVLFLQANETIPSEQWRELKLLLQNPAAEAYLIDVVDPREDGVVSSPTQHLRLIRNRKDYRFRYRSAASIPDEVLYSVQPSSLFITRRGDAAVSWQSEERNRLLELDLSEQPKDGYVCYLEGIALLNENKYEDSAAFFELARRAFGGGYLYTPHLYRCLAVCLMSLGRNKEATEVLTEGFWLFPFYTDLLVLQAELSRQLGRPEAALQYLQTGIALRKAPTVGVPLPEIDLSVMEEMLTAVRATLPG